MIETNIARLESLCQTIPDLLYQIPEDEFSHKPSPYTWSKKEIMGHLIDSANNNHQRFVRAQFENIPSISYLQNNWVESSYYQAMERELIISLWISYNMVIANIIRNIPPLDLKKLCHAGGDDHTIEWLFVDYIDHMEHHLRHLLGNQNF